MQEIIYYITIYKRQAEYCVQLVVTYKLLVSLWWKFEKNDYFVVDVGEGRDKCPSYATEKIQDSNCKY